MNQSKHPDIGNKLFGIYLGTVLQHLSHGQLKVYIQGIYPEEWINEPDRLPVCQQIVSQFAGSHNGNGVFSYPNINSTVVCMFANGDQNFPLAMGTLLGGQNAFGQYELIKNPDEIVSDKHLITAGKSHIQMYESGKISSIVCYPIRTDAKVEYSDIPNAELSTDHVVEREICDKIASDEIENINCQHVLDNQVNYGTISSSTHYFNPINKNINTSVEIDGVPGTIIARKNGTISTDSYNIIDNIGYRSIGQLSATKLTDLSTVVAGSTNINTYSSINQKVENAIDHNIDGYYQVNLISDLTATINNTISKNGQVETTIANIKTNADAKNYVNIDFSFGSESNVKSKSSEIYKNTTTNDNIVKTSKLTSYTLFDAHNGSIDFSTLSGLNYFEANQKINLTKNIKHKSNAKGFIDCDRGILFKSVYDDNTTTSIDGNAITTINKNLTLIDAQNNSKPGIKLESKINQTVIAGGTPTISNVECKMNQSPTDGSIEISIVNKVSSDECSIKMDKDGNIKIKASKSLEIEAPTISIFGASVSVNASDLTCDAKNTTYTASTMNITGGSGDCKIKNVSLLNHVHQETQAGDVVAPQPTKTATASN